MTKTEQSFTLDRVTIASAFLTDVQNDPEQSQTDVDAVRDGLFSAQKDAEKAGYGDREILPAIRKGI